MPVRVFLASDELPRRGEASVIIPFLAYLEFREFPARRLWNGTEAVEKHYEPKPLPEPTESDLARTVKVQDEYTQMNNAALDAIKNWARLENAMAYLMNKFFPAYTSLGQSLYYTPSSTETRINLLNTCFYDLCHTRPEFDTLWSLWGMLQTRISRSKGTRNKIVHGNITSIWRGNKDPKVRLQYPLLDHSPGNKDRVYQIESDRRAGAKGRPYQYPGMSSHDVDKAARVFFGLSALVDRFRWPVVIAREAPEAVTLLYKALCELEGELGQEDDLPVGGPNQEESEDQPLPTPASPARGKPAHERPSAKQRREDALAKKTPPLS
jgi:hypothetical protein